MQKTKTLAICLLLAFQFSFITLSSSDFAKAENHVIMGYLFPRISVERSISFVSGGYVMINDTFLLSPSNLSDSTYSITDYTIGLPKNYSDNLVYYSASGDGEKMTMEPAEKTDEGFLWLKIFFPRPIEMENDETYSFTVSYAFFDLIERKNGNLFHAAFPLYPALESDAEHCNVTVTLPVAASSYPRETLSNKTAAPTVLYNFTSPLASYANISSWVEFSTSVFELFKLEEMKKEIVIDPWGKITVTDFYQITRMVNVYRITFILPKGAGDISVYDAYGKYGQTQLSISKGNYTELGVTPGGILKESNNVRLAISYTLPFWENIVKSSWQDYALNISVMEANVGLISKPETWIIGKISVSALLPEGAKPQVEPSESWFNVTKYQNIGFSLKYRYIILWAAFRPTLWAGLALGLAVLIFSFIKLAGKTGVSTVTVASPETIKKFIESLEERGHIISEIENLEQQSRRGKISRRNYRLRRKTLEERLSIIQKNISSLKVEIESFGARYADIIKRFETASIDVETMNRNIVDVESRYQRGEISAEARKKLLDEYRRKKENAENIIDEMLLRLKEELR